MEPCTVEASYRNASIAPTLPPRGPDPALRRLGDEIAELAAQLDAASARLLDLIRRFDAEGGWNNGFRSCAEWLSWRTGLDVGAAREKVRVARALRRGWSSTRTARPRAGSASAWMSPMRWTCSTPWPAR